MCQHSLLLIPKMEHRCEPRAVWHIFMLGGRVPSDLMLDSSSVLVTSLVFKVLFLDPAGHFISGELVISLGIQSYS